MDEARSTYGAEERCKQSFGGGSLREEDHLEDSGLDGRIILNGSSGSGLGAWTGLIWLRIGTGGVHL